MKHKQEISLKILDEIDREIHHLQMYMTNDPKIYLSQVEKLLKDKYSEIIQQEEKCPLDHALIQTMKVRHKSGTVMTTDASYCGLCGKKLSN